MNLELVLLDGGSVLFNEKKVDSVGDMALT